MQVILLEQLQGLGKLGETVSVKDGYARNFLLPQKKALPASPENVAKFEAQKAELEKANADAQKAAEATAKTLDGVKVNLERPASETGQLYGSVKPRDIADALAEQKITIDRAAVQIGQPIKEVGEHAITIALHAEVIVPITVDIARQSS